MTGKKRNKSQQVRRKTSDSMSIQDTRMAMPLDNTSSTQAVGGTMRKFVNGLRWVSAMILKPVDAVITLLFFVELSSYRFCARRLPNLGMLKSHDQSEITDENARLNDRIRTLEANLQSFTTQRQELDNEYRGCVDRLNAEMQDLTVRNQQRERELKKKLNEVGKEKEEALRRLSEIISVKLRDNNPNIVDLNDQCRPTKLAEMFSELYDNEWTNAFGILDGTLTERQSIVVLLDIVMEAYEFCSVVVNGSWQHLEKWFFDNKVKASSEQQKVIKWLKDNRKALIKRKVQETTQLFVGKIQEMCVEKQIEPLLDNEGVAEYFVKCIELCLLMTANDPPVVIVCPDWKPCRLPAIETAPSLNDNGVSDGEKIQPDTNASNGEITQHDTNAHDDEITQHDTNAPDGEITQHDTNASDGKIIQPGPNVPSPAKSFNKDIFKEYTKRGKFMEYVVWPVMYLHEGGSTLSKGVAQGTNDEGGSDGYSWRVNT